MDRHELTFITKLKKFVESQTVQSSGLSIEDIFFRLLRSELGKCRDLVESYLSTLTDDYRDMMDEVGILQTVMRIGRIHVELRSLFDSEPPAPQPVRTWRQINVAKHRLPNLSGN